VGLHSSLALDLAGHPRISYTSAANDSLKYAVWTDGLWSTVELKSGWQVAAYTALVLDKDHPRISYYDPGWRYLRLAWGEPFGVYMPLVTSAVRRPPQPGDAGVRRRLARRGQTRYNCDDDGACACPHLAAPLRQIGLNLRRGLRSKQWTQIRLLPG